MAHCINCGTKMSDGLCPHCEEEAFIIETQGDYADGFSDQFMQKAEGQFAARRKRKTPEIKTGAEAPAEGEA